MTELDETTATLRDEEIRTIVSGVTRAQTGDIDSVDPDTDGVDTTDTDGVDTTDADGVDSTDTDAQDR